MHATSWRNAYRGILSDDYLDDGRVDGDLVAIWTKRLATANEGRLVLLAEEDGELLGFACVFLDSDPRWGALLDNLHVAPHMKGKGLGRKLFATAAAWCNERRRGTPIHFWVYEGNRDARAFYERLGARQVERVRKPLEDGGETESLRYVLEDVRELAS